MTTTVRKVLSAWRHGSALSSISLLRLVSASRYPQTAILFPLHLPRFSISSGGGMRLPHTAMLLLLHLDRIALLAALSSHDASLFLPHDASRPIRLSSALFIGSPGAPYASSLSPYSELRRILNGWSTAAGGRSAAGAPADRAGLVVSSIKAIVATTTKVETTCVVCGMSVFWRFAIIIQLPRAHTWVVYELPVHQTAVHIYTIP